MIDSRVKALLRSLNEQGVTGICTRCPVCERAGKFSVNFRDGLALYCCHRATCGVRGVYAIAGGSQTSRAGRVSTAFTPRPLTAEYRTPHSSDYWFQYVAKRLDPLVSIHEWSIENGFRVLMHEPGTCVWEIRNLQKYHLGYVTRTVDKRVLAWMVSDAPRYGFWPGDRAGLGDAAPVLIVEDPMSAALFPGEAIALLGTNLSREAVAEFRRLLPAAPFHVALDPDAMGKASLVVGRLRAAGLEARITPIERDVKDMKPEERMELFRSLR